MKRLLFILFTLHLSLLSSFAQQMTMKQVFINAPDSILPLMTNVNRLDCIDFIENNMEAKVKDKFQNPIVLEALTRNYLRIKTSDVSTTEWKLFTGSEQTGDSVQYLLMVNTCTAPGSDSNVMLYTTDWKFARNIEQPNIDDFFKPECNMQSDSILSLKAEIATLPLMIARLSPDDNAITWIIETRELTGNAKKTANYCLQPLKIKITNE